MSAVDFASLPAETQTQLIQKLTPRTNEFIPPSLTTYNSNRKQRAFLLLNDREVFYGGAAGGAKTSGILAAALQYVDVPHYHALLLRRNYKQLATPGSWIPMAHEWLDRTSARWNQGQKSWTFPSGATLTFGFVGQGEEDVRKYETAAYSFIGIDEVTAWREADYTFLFSRIRRRRGLRVPSRMRSASNPGGRGHEWVKSRFVNPQTRRPSAVFLPAMLTDNVYLDQADYIENLREVHPTLWRRLLYGDWDISDPGEMFQPRVWLDPEQHYLDAVPEHCQARVRYWDLAASEVTQANPDPDWTVGFRMSRVLPSMIGETYEGARRDKHLYVIEHVIRVRRTSGRVERLVRATALEEPPKTKQWMEQEPGQSGKAQVAHYREDVMPTSVPIHGHPARTSKGERARPWAGAMENQRCRVVRGPWNEPLFDELEAFSEVPAHSGAHDDQVDGGSGAFEKLRRVPARAGVIGSVPGGQV